jgi:hypothetical protein
MLIAGGLAARGCSAHFSNVQQFPAISRHLPEQQK